jgi:hypothetical protein
MPRDLTSLQLTRFEAISGRVTRITDASWAMFPYRWQVYLACVVLAPASNYMPGKEMPWDTLNYHLYLGFSAFNDRFKQDYFAPAFCDWEKAPLHLESGIRSGI